MLKKVIAWVRARKWTSLAFPTLLLFVGIFLFAGTRAQSFTQCANDYEGNSTKQDKQGRYYRAALFIDCETTFLNDNSSAITGAATAFLAWITWMLVRLGREQSKTSRAQLRAYINIREAGISGTYAEITVENFGQTPAYKVSYWADCTLNGIGDEPTFQMPQGAELSAEIVVGPTGQFKMQPVLVDKRDNNANYSQYRIERTRGTIHAFGKITYEDVFQTKHTTEFFLRVPLPGGAFYVVGPHNTAD